MEKGCLGRRGRRMDVLGEEEVWIRR